jgi:DNA-binding CsgD family transcriptional regulator
LAAGFTRARRRIQAHAALRTAPSTTLAELTDREWQVLEFVALGRTNRAIARTMAVSPRTVAKHLEHVYAKLNVTSRAAAVTRSMSSAGQEITPSAGTTKVGAFTYQATDCRGASALRSSPATGSRPRN